MADKSKRYLKTRYALDQVPTLEGKRIYFDSMAEMLVTRAQEIPDKEYVLYYEEVITFNQVNERANKVANFLKEKGVAKGDICSVMVLNSPEIHYTMFGAQKLGAVAGAINYMLKAPEIAYVLDDSKPKVAFVSSGFMAEFAKGYEMAQHKPIIIEVEQGVEHGTQVAEGVLSEILAKYPADEAIVPQSLDDPCMLLYSSGTTGNPKGILTSNRNVFAICKDMARFGVFIPEDIILIVLPMFHTNPLCIWTYSGLYQGVTLCIRKMFSPTDFWPSLERYGVTACFGVPAMYSYILYHVDPGSIDYSKIKLRYAISGAAPMPIELIRDFKDKYGVNVIDGYGLTESCAVSILTMCAPHKEGSIGQALFEQEIEIMDEDNNIMPYGKIGEICIKGDSVMLGYLNQPEATKDTIRDGWLHTGDLGYMDEEGYVFFTGRLKEMINRGGENIYPREIEAPLEAHPKVREVAAVGQPDPSLGERVKVCIIPKEPGSLTTEEIKDYLRDKIAQYKIPEIVEFYDDFPRTQTGKVMKKYLKNPRT